MLYTRALHRARALAPRQRMALLHGLAKAKSSRARQAAVPILPGRGRPPSPLWPDRWADMSLVHWSHF
jgi:hypothetical protein